MGGLCFTADDDEPRKTDFSIPQQRHRRDTLWDFDIGDRVLLVNVTDRSIEGNTARIVHTLRNNSGLVGHSKLLIQIDSTSETIPIQPHQVRILTETQNQVLDFISELDLLVDVACREQLENASIKSYSQVENVLRSSFQVEPFSFKPSLRHAYTEFQHSLSTRLAYEETFCRPIPKTKIRTFLKFFKQALFTRCYAFYVYEDIYSLFPSDRSPFSRRILRRLFHQACGSEFTISYEEVLCLVFSRIQSFFGFDLGSRCKVAFKSLGKNKLTFDEFMTFFEYLERILEIKLQLDDPNTETINAHDLDRLEPLLNDWQKNKPICRHEIYFDDFFAGLVNNINQSESGEIRLQSPTARPKTLFFPPQNSTNSLTISELQDLLGKKPWNQQKRNFLFIKCDRLHQQKLFKEHVTYTFLQEFSDKQNVKKISSSEFKKCLDLAFDEVCEVVEEDTLETSLTCSDSGLANFLLKDQFSSFIEALISLLETKFELVQIFENLKKTLPYHPTTDETLLIVFQKFTINKSHRRVTLGELVLGIIRLNPCSLSVQNVLKQAIGCAFKLSNTFYLNQNVVLYQHFPVFCQAFLCFLELSLQVRIDGLLTLNRNDYDQEFITVIASWDLPLVEKRRLFRNSVASLPFAEYFCRLWTNSITEKPDIIILHE